MKITHFIIGLMVLILSSCGQTCEDLPSSYESHDAAIELVESTEFEHSNEISTPESSWVRSGSFYSCDGKSGYFILTTKNDKIIHQDVPMKVWEGFETAESHGTFYNENISGKFPLNIE